MNMESESLCKSYYVYILKCSDNTLYTGYTTDIHRRLSEHNKGIGAKYTRGRTPCELLYYMNYNTKSEALKEEYRIKQLSRDDKLALIRRKENYYGT